MHLPAISRQAGVEVCRDASGLELLLSCGWSLAGISAEFRVAPAARRGRNLFSRSIWTATTYFAIRFGVPRAKTPTLICHLAPPLGRGIACSAASVILNLVPPVHSLVDIANPTRTNSESCSTVKPCATITASVAPAPPQPASSVSARRSWGLGRRRRRTSSIIAAPFHPHGESD